MVEGSAEKRIERRDRREHARNLSLPPTPRAHLIPTQVEFQRWTPCPPRIQRSIPRLWEIQAFLVGLVNHFELEMTKESNNIKRVASFVIVAMVRGQEKKGVQMPLKAKFAPPEEDF